MESNKKHWSKKLKDENSKLLSDIEKIVNGDAITILRYKLKFKMRDDLETMIWYGNSSLNTNDGLKD